MSSAQLRLKVLAATLDELGAHEAALAAIDKASAGACIWKMLPHAQTTCAVAVQVFDRTRLRGSAHDLDQLIE